MNRTVTFKEYEAFKKTLERLEATPSWKKTVAKEGELHRHISCSIPGLKLDQDGKIVLIQ